MNTKKKRLEFYKELLKVVCKDPDTCVGMCYYIRRMTSGLYDIQDFSELYKCKPTGAGIYWFPLNRKGWQKRIDIIYNIIQEMENDREAIS